MTWQELFDEIKAGKLGGVYLFHGPEEFIKKSALDKIREAVLPAGLEILAVSDTASEVRVRVTEGKYHQVKRMFAARGHEVLALHRAAFGPLTIPEGLKEGEHIRLTDEQVQLLRDAINR